MAPTISRSAVRPPSRWLLSPFAWIARRRLRQSFRAVRLMGGERLAAQTAGPVIVYLNHPSWWDPLVCLTVARALLPGRTHHGPISAASLKQYPMFERLGMFPVEQDSLRGVAQFLRGSQAVLEAGGVLWVTAQGSFTDARERPVELKSGLGALLRRLPQATVVPLALEYTFWNQRLPEVLVAIGEPQLVQGPDATPAAWTSRLEGLLEELQDALAAASMQRDPARFDRLLEGRRGTAGVYGAWQWLLGRKADHAAAEDKP